MAQIDENEEKMFEHYLELPTNVRTRSINKMNPDDRFRLTRCSKLCSKEAQASKNYIHELSVMCWENYMEIKVIVNKEGLNGRGFYLTIVDRLGRKYKEYRSVADDRWWDVELDSSIDLVQYAIEELKLRLKIYEGSIKILRISDFSFMLTNVDFEIESLNNLETLSIVSNFNIAQFLLKLQKPLKKLYIQERDNTSLSTNCQQVYQVQHEIFWPSANFDIEQLRSLSAEKVYTNIGRLAEKDIFNLIRSWQDGTFGKQIVRYRWFLEESSFDKNKFLRLLRVENQEHQQFEIKHYNKPGKSAVLSYRSRTIEFNAGHVDSESDSDADF